MLNPYHMKLWEANRMATIPGIGKDAPTVTNEAGGRQSHTPYRADLLPAAATLAVCKVLDEGARKHGERNWLKLTVDEQLNHALIHVLAHLAGDRSDDHLPHAACRLLMALERNLIDSSWKDTEADVTPQHKPELYREVECRPRLVNPDA